MYIVSLLSCEHVVSLVREFDSFAFGMRALGVLHLCTGLVCVCVGSERVHSCFACSGVCPRDFILVCFDFACHWSGVVTRLWGGLLCMCV